MKIEIRGATVSAPESVKLSGYVNAVERRSAVLPQRICRTAPGNFVEVIRSGTFGASLSARPEVQLKFNHERTIGGTGNGLELREDNIGLHAEATITDPDVVSAARAHKLTGWSFGFTSPKEDWSDPDSEGVYTRSISGLDLVEVSILTKRPAYPATSVEVRDGETNTNSENWYREYEFRQHEEENEVEDSTETEINTNNVRQAELDLIRLGGIIYES